MRMINRITRRAVWKASLVFLALIPLFSLTSGFAEILYYRRLMWVSEFLLLIWPYAALLVAFFTAMALAADNRLRASAVILSLAFVCSWTVFLYDLYHPLTRAQMQAGGSVPYYVFWPWWSRVWQFLQ